MKWFADVRGDGHRSLSVLLGVAAIAVSVAAWTPALHALEERATGGQLDLVWHPGFGLTNNLAGALLTPDHPAYSNPSGDHTVAVATNSIPDSGGVILSATDPQGDADYQWETWIFTGDGNTRRGLVVRADPANGFASCYQFVIQSGMLQINFRKLVNSAPTTLGSWFTNTLPGGLPSTNTWHHMKVSAIGNEFRCWWDGTELTTTPIVDSDHASGWVGVYNFRFDLGGVPVYFDDIILTPSGAVSNQHIGWGAFKARYRR